MPLHTFLPMYYVYETPEASERCRHTIRSGRSLCHRLWSDCLIAVSQSFADRPSGIFVPFGRRKVARRVSSDSDRMSDMPRVNMRMTVRIETQRRHQANQAAKFADKILPFPKIGKAFSGVFFGSERARVSSSRRGAVAPMNERSNE